MLSEDNQPIPEPIQEIPFYPGYPDDESMIDPNSMVRVDKLDDGTEIYETMPSEDEEEKEKPSDNDFYANLAEEMSKEDLNKLASELIEEVEEDIQARSQWEQSTKLVMDMLGYRVDEYSSDNSVWNCGAYDLTLATALMNAYAVITSELLPASGPADTRIMGEITKAKEDKAERGKEFLNLYLTVLDKPYYKDFRRLILMAIFYGCAFKKIIQDPLLKRPIARSVSPIDLIIDNRTSNYLESSRITFREEISKTTILKKQSIGEYIKGELVQKDTDTSDSEEQNSPVKETIDSQQGISTEGYEKSNKQLIYEIQTDVEIEGDGLYYEEGYPKPYIITVSVTNKKICAIRRNWSENAKGEEEFKRVRQYVGYYYAEGFSIYGLGLAQMLGSTAVVNTAILRQTVDAVELKMFPGGIKDKGIKSVDNNLRSPPGGWKEVETDGMRPLTDYFMTMPGPDMTPVPLQLRSEMKEEALRLAGAAQDKIAENSPQTSAVTSLAALHVANRVQSTVLKSFRESLSEELEMIAALFGEFLPDENQPQQLPEPMMGQEGEGDPSQPMVAPQDASQPATFTIAGKEISIVKSDFNGDISVIPAADVNVTTEVQRLIVSGELLRLATENPDIFDKRKAIIRYLEAMRVGDIPEMLIPEPQEAQPLDPITENQNAINNLPLKAADWQDHQSHIMTHAPMLEQLQQSNPTAVQSLTAHIQSHMAMQYLIEMQQAMQQQMPPIEQLQDPQVQNQVAMAAAQAAQQLQQQQQQAEKDQQLDANMIAALDIKQREFETNTRREIATEKTELESYKTQMNFELQQKKIETDLEIAELKSKVDLLIADKRAQPKPQEIRV